MSGSHPVGGQPQGPGYGPEGYPGVPQPYGGQSGPGYGAPGGPAAPYGPGYGGPAGPGGPGYSGPGGPGGPTGPGGPGGPGYGGPTGGPPAPKKTNTKVLVIIGAGVLALILLVVGAGVLVNRIRTAAEPVSPADPQASAPGTAAGTAAGTASDAVESYLKALAAGDADAALALSDTQAADKTFLTDAVLADSNSRAPITDIKVPVVNDEYAYNVDASYKMGDQPVAQTYSVKKAGGGWKVREGFAELNLSNVRNKTLPLVMNKIAVKSDQVRVFPGSYVLTSGNTFIDYGKENVLLLESPSDYPSTADVQPTLTAAGAKAFEDAAVAALKKCAVDGDLSPAGCPNAIREASYQKIDDDSVRWKVASDPMANIKPRLDFQNPVIVTANGAIPFQFTAKGTEFDRPSNYEQTVSTYVKMTADLTKSPIKVTFTR